MKTRTAQYGHSIAIMLLHIVAYCIRIRIFVASFVSQIHTHSKFHFMTSVRMLTVHNNNDWCYKGQCGAVLSVYPCVLYSLFLVERIAVIGYSVWHMSKIIYGH